MTYVRRKRTTKKGSYRRFRRNYRRRYSRTYKMYKALTRRIAGEVNKFEITPSDFSVQNISFNSNRVTFSIPTYPLNTITSGEAYIFPINWIYTAPYPTATDAIFTSQNNLIDYSGESIGGTGTLNNRQYKQPAYYKILNQSSNLISDASSQLQYRLAYIYINSVFRAALTEGGTLTEVGCVRFVIVKDKQPQDQGATWFNADDPKRSVFNSNTINAQLNQQSLGRFKVCYDKRKYFSNIQPYKIFKYFKKVSTKVRNNVGNLSTSNVRSSTIGSEANPQLYIDGFVADQTSEVPVQTNAYYLMIFSDGLNFTLDTDSENGETGSGNFNLFSRLAYYNN